MACFQISSNKFRFTDEQELDGLVADDENCSVSALPRRMSTTPATTIQPIPPASSFFIFSQTNRFLLFLDPNFSFFLVWTLIFFSSNSFSFSSSFFLVGRKMFIEWNLIINWLKTAVKFCPEKMKAEQVFPKQFSLILERFPTQSFLFVNCYCFCPQSVNIAPVALQTNV